MNCWNGAGSAILLPARTDELIMADATAPTSAGSPWRTVGTIPRHQRNQARPVPRTRPVPADQPLYGAIAYSPSTRRYGSSAAESDPESAQSQALANCGEPDAGILIWGMNTYLALVIGDAGAGWAWNDDRWRARRVAFDRCRMQTLNPRLTLLFHTSGNRSHRRAAKQTNAIAPPRTMGTGLDSEEHLTAWWAQLLDSPWISSRSAPSSEKVWLSTMFAVLFLWPTVVVLVEGQSVYILIGTLALSVRFALGAWSTYLQLKLAHHGLDDVLWYDMPSLTRRAGGPVRRLLAQWRLATIAKLVVSVTFLVVIAAFLVEWWPQFANHFNKGPVCEHPDPSFGWCS